MIKGNSIYPWYSGCIIYSLIFALVFIPALGSGQASPGSIEELRGYIHPGDINFYLLPNLKQGDTLYAYAYGTSGNLDPFLALANTSLNASSLKEDFTVDVERNIAKDQGPIISISEIADKYSLTWDDDSGKGYSAAFQFKIPANGDYRLLVVSSPGRRSFGSYRLLIGVNAPQVLMGQANSTGQSIAVLDKNSSEAGYAIQQLNGRLTANKPSTFYILNPVNSGDTFYAFIKATSGDLIPVLILNDYGNKTLRTGNYAGLKTNGTLEYTFKEDSINNRLIIFSGRKNGNTTSGDYRLLVSVNVPQVTLGQAKANITARTVLREPIKAKIAVQLDHITGVNQVAGSFDITASIWMQWTDPALAFSPDSCNCSLKTYRSIDQFVQSEGEMWPEFTIANQQGNRWTQNRIIAVKPNGEATYFERFWVTIQEPDFDFRIYPLDEQTFHIQIDSLYPEELYTYSIWAEKNSLGNDLGVNDWVIEGFNTNVSSTRIYDVNSRFTFQFNAKRQLIYYILRIFIPIFIIVIISWLTFFLNDYIKRGDIAGANLLLFIAFNFAIGSDLPRLGYATLLDWVIVYTFIFTSLVFAYNIYLRVLEINQRNAFAESIDRVAIWLYPIMYLFGFVLIPFIVYIIR